MNEKERFRETLLFGKPDKIPLMPGGPRESTLKRWHKEGLPEGKDYFDEISRILNIPVERPKTSRTDTGVSFRMIPEFEEKVLEHKDGHYIVRDWMGAITEISDQYDYTYIRSARDFVTRKWHKFPVENEKDWEQMKLRFDAGSHERFPADFIERCNKLKSRDYVLNICFNGPFWQMREWCGFENLCIYMAEKPEFVKEMSLFWRDFVLDTLTPILKNVQVDHVLISEDMAYKAHSMISPKMTREFLFPCYQSWIPEIRKNNKNSVIEVDSDGHVGELIPLWIEAGVNCCSPVEVAAGNDIVGYRKKFGRKMAFRGGIDKRAIAKGGIAIKDELARVVPPLLKEGGFIPSCDHGVPHDISWQNFIEYTKLLAELTGWL